MKDVESIEEFFNCVLFIVNQLGSNGETIEGWLEIKDPYKHD